MLGHHPINQGMHYKRPRVAVEQHFSRVAVEMHYKRATSEARSDVMFASVLVIM